jgi:hypothetical protein
MMKKWIFLIAIAVGIYYQLHKPVEWQEFVSQEGSFSVSVPGKPSEQLQKKPIGTSGKSVDMHNFIVDRGDVAYLVSYTDTLGGAELVRTFKEKEQDLLDGAREGALEYSRGKLVSETRITLGKYPGRQIKIAGERGGIQFTAHWRFYLIGTQIYQLGILNPNSIDTTIEMAKFFDSFKLI